MTKFDFSAVKKELLDLAKGDFNDDAQAVYYVGYRIIEALETIANDSPPTATLNIQSVPGVAAKP